MSYALYPNPKNAYFLPSEMNRDFFSSVFYQVYTSSQMFFAQTPGRRPPCITGLRVNSVTLGWVGAPNECAPLRVHDAIAVFAALCLTRTRIADQGLGGFHEYCAGFARAIKFRVSCPGEFKICPNHRPQRSTGLHIRVWVTNSIQCKKTDLYTPRTPHRT